MKALSVIRIKNDFNKLLKVLIMDENMKTLIKDATMKVSIFL